MLTSLWDTSLDKEDLRMLIGQLSADEQLLLVYHLLQTIDERNFSDYLKKDEEIAFFQEESPSFNSKILSKIAQLHQAAQEVAFTSPPSTMPSPSIPFEFWNYQQVEDQFQLQKNAQSALLQAWLTTASELSELEKNTLALLQNELKENAQNWNEEELKFHFISPLVRLVNYHQAGYRSFLERKLSAEIDNIQVAGKVDFLIADGKFAPKQPYFCLHEYKRELSKTGEPLGQLLIAMLAAQAQNQSEMPIYGAYVIGRQWFFVVLEGKEYSVSEEFIATREDIFQIFRMLRQVKVFIEERK